MFNKILVVCVGNICRSPTAERLLKRYHPTLTVASAGLGALVGKGADDSAARVAQQHDLSLDGHCAKQVSSRIMIKSRVSAPHYLFTKGLLGCVQGAAGRMHFPATGAPTLVSFPVNLN